VKPILSLSINAGSIKSDFTENKTEKTYFSVEKESQWTFMDD
jgi:hypothetical protein